MDPREREIPPDDLGRPDHQPVPVSEDCGLVIFEDFPLQYDAWDVEIYHLDSCRSIKFDEVSVSLQDPLRASLRAVAKFGKSTAALTVSPLLYP